MNFRPIFKLYKESGKGKPVAKGRYMFNQGYTHIDVEKLPAGKYKLMLRSREKKSTIVKEGKYKLTTWGGTAEVGLKADQ